MTNNRKEPPRLSERELMDRFRSDVNLTSSRFCRSKRCLDLVLAALLVGPVSLVICMLVVVVRKTSEGPGIYRQERVGLRGRIFTIYKLRSMHIDAERRLGATWASKNDPRVTRVGYWLRKLHLDELPQIYNVLRGDMSFVGPRPERPEFVSLLYHDIDRYMNRLVVRPGITGLAQINLPPDSGWASARSKQILDLEYIQHGNLLLDLRMIGATALRIIGLKGEWVIRLTGLNRCANLKDVGETDVPSQPTTLSDLVGTPEADEVPTASPQDCGSIGCKTATESEFIVDPTVQAVAD